MKRWLHSLALCVALWPLLASTGGGLALHKCHLRLNSAPAWEALGAVPMHFVAPNLAERMIGVKTAYAFNQVYQRFFDSQTPKTKFWFLGGAAWLWLSLPISLVLGVALTRFALGPPTRTSRHIRGTRISTGERTPTLAEEMREWNRIVDRARSRSGSRRRPKRRI